MDVFLHTAWWEGTPNVVLEAQQLQLPVVVTRAGGAAEAVAHGETGYLVDRENVDELYQRLVEVIGDLEGWKRRAKVGPQFIARRFGVQRMVDDTLALQLRCLGEARPRADVEFEVA
jgi:glycosyltransferase involved in cell wall biosynthesis